MWRADRRARAEARGRRPRRAGGRHGQRCAGRLHRGEAPAGRQRRAGQQRRDLQEASAERRKLDRALPRGLGVLCVVCAEAVGVVEEGVAAALVEVEGRVHARVAQLRFELLGGLDRHELIAGAEVPEHRTVDLGEVGLAMGHHVVVADRRRDVRAGGRGPHRQTPAQAEADGTHARALVAGLGGEVVAGAAHVLLGLAPSTAPSSSVRPRSAARSSRRGTGPGRARRSLRRRSGRRSSGCGRPGPTTPASRSRPDRARRQASRGSRARWRRRLWGTRCRACVAPCGVEDGVPRRPGVREPAAANTLTARRPRAQVLGSAIDRSSTSTVNGKLLARYVGASRPSSSSLIASPAANS